MSKEAVNFGVQFILSDILEIIDDALAMDNKATVTMEIFEDNVLTSSREMNKTEYLEHTLEVIREKLSDEIDLDKWWLDEYKQSN